jgi:hypothetical protein
MSRGRHGNHAKANRQHRWTEEKIITKDGYVKLRVGLCHPLADPNGYAYEHLIVWVAAGNPRPFLGEVLHHKNGVKTDNRIENLESINRAEHNKQHNRDMGRDPETGRFVGKRLAGRILYGREWNEFPGDSRGTE